MKLRLPEMLRALEEREFRLLFAGQAISLLGDGMVGVALAFAVLDLTGSASDLGLVLLSYLAPRVVFMLAGGVRKLSKILALVVTAPLKSVSI